MKKKLNIKIDKKKAITLSFMILLLHPAIMNQEAEATSYIKQIIPISGTITAGVQNFDYTLPTAVSDQSKSIIFMSVRHIGDSQAKQTYKSWGFLSNSQLRFYGSSNVPASNLAVSFVGYIVEFTATSKIHVQHHLLTVNGADVNMEFTKTLSPAVDPNESFFTFNGLTMNHADTSWGSEEFGLMRIINSTHWGYEPFDAPDTGDTEVRFSVIDWNDSGFIRQTGTGTLVSGELTDTINPSPSIDRTRTIVFATTQIEDELDATSDEHGATVTINSSNQVVVQRDDEVCPVTNCEVNYRWNTLTFPSTFAKVLHGEMVDTTSTASNVQQTVDTTISAVPFARSIAIGTMQTPFGLGNARDSSGSEGSWDRLAYTIELTSSTNVRSITNDGQETPNMPFQVITFSAYQGIVDTAPVSDQVRKNISKNAVDVGVTVDFETKKEITKQNSDLASAGDTVSTGAIFVVNLNDNGTATDIVRINVTKMAEDAVSVGDQPVFNITKILSDVTSVFDTTIVTKTTDISLIDEATSDDIVILNITKQVSDVTSVNDSVDITRIRNLILNDTVTVDDPSILFIISSVVPNGTGTGSSGGGSSGGAGTPILQRLIGLSIKSELFNVKAGDVIPSDFIIQTFGQETSAVTLVSIEPEIGFNSWFRYSAFPDTLQFNTEIDNSRPTVDPARIRNTALDDFILNIPSVECKDLSVFDSPVSCFEEKIYEVPMIFKFKKGGLEFREKHIVIIDGTTAPTCDILCQFIEFINSNWWWLAGIIIMFTVLYLGVTVVNGKKIRVVNRIDRRYFTSFEAGRGKPRKKFKKGKGR